MSNGSHDQIEATGGSAPVAAAGRVDDDVERWRRQLYHVPSAAEKAADAERTRRWHEKTNGRELAEYKRHSAVFEENNRLLAAVGKPPVKIPAIDDPRDLGCPALVTQINLLGRLINEQVDTLNRCEAEEAEAQWQAEVADQPPMVRWLIAELLAVKAEVAELKAERSESAREIGRAEPVRPKAMSGMSIATGNGLCAEVSIPPSAARPDPSAARRIVSR
jgi:hypothetical protein